MKSRPSRFLKVIFIFVVVFALLRFMPVVLRLLQAVLVAVRAFWWAVLPAVIFGWLAWTSKRRARAAKLSEQPFEERPMRDVTNSVPSPPLSTD